MQRFFSLLLRFVCCSTQARLPSVFGAFLDQNDFWYSLLLAAICDCYATNSLIGVRTHSQHPFAGKSIRLARWHFCAGAFPTTHATLHTFSPTCCLAPARQDQVCGPTAGVACDSDTLLWKPGACDESTGLKLSRLRAFRRVMETLLHDLSPT